MLAFAIIGRGAICRRSLPPPKPEASCGSCTTMRCLCTFATTTKRSEEHTSELQSLMRISYAVFCLKKKKKNINNYNKQKQRPPHNENTTNNTTQYIYNII